MPDEPKITFQLTAQENRRLEVRLTASGGEAKGETALPPKDALDELALADPAHLPAVLVEKVGEALYRSLAGEAVDELVADTLNDAIRAGQPAQFELRFDPDQVILAGYPWEMIRNAQGQFLVRDGLVDLTRYITYPQPPPTFDASIRHLPLFRLISQPPSLPPITTIDLAIKPQETLPHATFEDFMRRLLVDRMALWGLQFDGHGALVSQCPKCNTLNGPDSLACWSCGESLKEARRVGALAFEASGSVNWVPTSEFGSVLYNAHVRLAMLLACETARVGNALVFSGLAPGLLLAGVPAVIGMQYPVRDDFANSFANEFYGALAKNGDLLAALRIARRMNMLGAWYSPALYLRRKPGDEEEQPRPVYLSRNIDTAAPAKVQAGVDFLARLWIRRPETKPLTVGQLRKELDIPKSVPVRQNKGEAEVKFEPVEGRKLRRGEVEVQMTSAACDVKPQERIKLFIDETLDAPPAIFTARARQTGRIPLIFSVYQDGGQIHSVVHHVDVTEQAFATGSVSSLPVDEVAVHSQSVAVESGEALVPGGFRGTIPPRPGSVPSGGMAPPQPGPVPSRGGPVSPPPPPPPAAAAWLLTEDGRSFQLTSGRVHIGRSSENEVHLTGDQTVSRRHAIIVEQDGEYALQDLGSRGGTYVNGDEITTVVLEDGDIIQLGQHTRLQFRLEGSTRAEPPPSDMDETLARPPSKKATPPPEEDIPDKEEWREELEDLKDIVEQIEPDSKAGEPAKPKSSMAPDQAAPSEPAPASPDWGSDRQLTPEEWQAQEKMRRKAEQPQEPQYSPPPPAATRSPDLAPQPGPGNYPRQRSTRPTPRPPQMESPSRLPMLVGGCIGLVVVVGLILLGVVILFNGCSGPGPVVPEDRPRPEITPLIVEPGDTASPVIEKVEHSPGEVGYGEYCPESEKQFTVQAQVRDDVGLQEVTLVYFFRADNGNQVGGEMVPMAEIRPGLYAVTIPTHVAQEAGYSASYGKIFYTITAVDTSGNQATSGNPREIPIHQCLG